MHSDVSNEVQLENKQISDIAQLHVDVSVQFSFRMKKCLVMMHMKLYVAEIMYDS